MILVLFSLCFAKTIVTPTPAQLRYQSTDFVALIHFNMGTYAHNGDPCCDHTNWNVKAPYATGKTSNAGTFNPVKLNTTQWFESVTALGANIAVLTAKHGCGFLLWPSKSKFPNGDPYNYGVMTPNATIQIDVLREFVNSAKDAGVGYGFYYSIMKNFYLCHSFSGSDSCGKGILPGQHELTPDEYKSIAAQQVTELWTEYGDLTEIWVDSGTDDLDDLMIKLQPQAVGTKQNPISWCGTESGHPSENVGPGPVWSLAYGPGFSYFGNPNGTEWVPIQCDPQLFQEHVWFWEPNLTVRTLEEMIPIYHDIVGRGMVMELAFSIDRDGLVEDTHAMVYKQLGDWVRECYGSPLATASPGMTSEPITIQFTCADAKCEFDRFQLQEDIAMGQRVRKYSVEMSSNGKWMPLATAEAIGKKRIILLNETMTISKGEKADLRLNIQQSIAIPVMKQFAVYKPCRTSIK